MKLAEASRMPKLYHTIPGEEYSSDKSEVLKWLANNPLLISYIFDQASNAKEIFYNSNTKTWQGVDFHD